MSIGNGFSVIIPAYNEAETIENILRNLYKVLSDADMNYEVIVVDDGSTDKTYSIASSLPGTKVIRHPYNKGNGAAVKAGILGAQGEKIIIIDSDGQHDPKHILEMLRLLDEYDLVVGARESFGIGRRGFGNFLVSKLASYLSGIEISDLTCGYRSFRKEKMLEFIHILPNGFSLPSTSTLAFATSGCNVKFIPISAHKRQGGESTIKVFRDGMKFMVLITRMISLFKPLKVFVPVSAVLLTLSFFWSIRTVTISNQLTPTVAMLFLGSIFVFLFGLLADQIAETRLSIGKINKMLMNKKNEEKT
jgi:glycosyltransferase involved in cell wall biosynthesis